MRILLLRCSAEENIYFDGPDYYYISVDILLPW